MVTNLAIVFLGPTLKEPSRPILAVLLTIDLGCASGSFRNQGKGQRQNQVYKTLRKQTSWFLVVYLIYIQYIILDIYIPNLSVCLPVILYNLIQSDPISSLSTDEVCTAIRNHLQGIPSAPKCGCQVDAGHHGYHWPPLCKCCDEMDLAVEKHPKFQNDLQSFYENHVEVPKSTLDVLQLCPVRFHGQWCPYDEFQIFGCPSVNQQNRSKQYITGWWFESLWKIISQLGWLFPIYGKVKNVPKHQPDKYAGRVMALREEWSTNDWFSMS